MDAQEILCGRYMEGVLDKKTDSTLTVRDGLLVKVDGCSSMFRPWRVVEDG